MNTVRSLHNTDGSSLDCRAVVARQLSRSDCFDRGYDPMCGARPLKRVIQAEIQNELAKALLGGEFSPQSTIEVDVSPGGERLAFEEG